MSHLVNELSLFATINNEKRTFSNTIIKQIQFFGTTSLERIIYVNQNGFSWSTNNELAAAGTHSYFNCHVNFEKCELILFANIFVSQRRFDKIPSVKITLTLRRINFPAKTLVLDKKVKNVK